ncbi:hypothetical protein [Paenibacillus brevis]|uniref:Uncharacterized protein n=1 Tax=Paenibacillus brevis TaxID=2841508 RepID=A0ABS6FJA1_9BACL|nr:hypothetical protein [Paenibacillus brevis]MBU5670255.1 hypothetical protein [Paenibacillus brevis]
MSRKTKDAEQVITVQTAVPVVIWKVKRPLNEQQHEELARKLQIEQERSGLKVMLVPHSVDAEIGAALEDQQVATEDDQTPSSGDEGTADQKKEDEQPSKDGGSNE